jgi:hypothetical protein
MVLPFTAAWLSMLDMPGQELGSLALMTVYASRRSPKKTLFLGLHASKV